MNTTANQQASGLQIFYNENENVSIRTKVINGEPWFVGKDVCKLLDLSNNRKALQALDDDEKGVTNCYTLGGNQELTVINESGLYHLIFISRKPEARAIRKWVTGTVLPSIRKTGSYSVSGVQTEVKQRLPLPKYRPFFAEWKEKMKPYISRAELCLVAEKRRVTISHVLKVYAGTAVSANVARSIQLYAKCNRDNGTIYPEKKPTYEQLNIEWEE